MALDMTPEQKEIGKTNFQRVVGKHYVDRRDFMKGLLAAGTVLPIDYGKLKNASNLLPAMKYPYGVGHIYSGKVGVYNPKMITAAPASYKDVFDPKHGNKLGIIDIQYQYTLNCAALAAGGKVNDLEPGKKLLLECKKAGMRIYPTNEAFAQGLKAEEFGIGPVNAIPKALKLAGLTLDDISVIELNEAFAAQSLAVIKQAGLDASKVNPNGGAIALGHPLGCTGAKLTASILRELQRRDARYGMVTMCIGGGMGAAGIIERLS